MKNYNRSSFPWKPQGMKMSNDLFMQRKDHPMMIRFFFDIDDMGGTLLPPSF